MSKTDGSRRKPTLEEVREQFAQWRKNKGRGEKIPKDLWAAAAVLTRDHSIHKVSRSLRLSFTELKKRASAKVSCRAAACSSPFVELRVPAAGPVGVAPEYLVEFEGARGRRIRVVMKGGHGDEMMRVVRELWSWRG